MKLIKSIIVLLSLMISSLSAIADVTFVTGKVNGGQGLVIRLMSYADQVTYLRKTLDSETIGEDGSFRLKADLQKTIYAWIDIEFRQSDIYIQPGKLYEVEIDLSRSSLSTSYYDRSPLPMTILTDDPDHLNIYIRDFNSLYNDFMLNYAANMRASGSSGAYNAFRTAIDMRFKNAQNPYFLDYVKYKSASVEMFLRLKSRDKAGLEYLTGQPLALENVEYMDYFNLFFEKYFISGSKYFSYNKTYDMINGGAGLEAFIDSLDADPVLHDIGLKELLLLSGLKELYQVSGFNRERIIGLVKGLSETAVSPELRNIASDVLQQFQRLKPGSAAPDFRLPAVEGGRDYTLADFRGKYVYLAFFDSRNPASQAELAMIGGLYKDFKDKVNFVAISVDRDPAVIAGNPNIPPGTWQVLYYNKDLDLLERYDAIAYPYFILIDQEGRIVNCPAPSPSEDISKTLSSI